MEQLSEYDTSVTVLEFFKEITYLNYQYSEPWKGQKSLYIPSDLYLEQVSNMMKQILIEGFFNPIDKVTIGGK